MIPQQINISSEHIINHLRIIESKIKRSHFEEYVPLIGIITIDSVNEEANRMMKHAELLGYKASVEFESLDEGQGGIIILNADRIAHIKISENYRNNRAAILAVLAHEICHKVLHVNNLILPTVLMTEVYTDITTMYMGFGRQIIDGCITHQGNTTHYLGYLSFDTYKTTYAFVRAIYNHEGLPDSELFFIDSITRIAFNEWNSRWHDNSSPNEKFVAEVKTKMELINYADTLSALLHQLCDKMASEIDTNEKRIFSDIRLDNNIESFWQICEQIKKEDKDEILKNDFEQNFETDSLSIKNREDIKLMLISLLAKLSQELDIISVKILSRCPFCNTKINGEHKEPVGIFICPSCGRRVPITDGGKFLSLKLLHSKEDGEYERRVAIEREKITKSHDEAIQLLRDKQLEQFRWFREMENDYLSTAKRELEKKFFPELEGSLPWYIRIFAKKYFKEKNS